jgi:hypothetical protein
VEETNVKKIRKDLESIEVEEERTRKEIEEIDDQMDKLDKEGKNGLSAEEATGEKQEKDEDDVGEEGRSPIMVKAPMRVSREEIELHEATHTPYRPWCKYCVKARGRNDPHRKRQEEQMDDEIPKVPRISMDYFFMSEADQKASKNPIMVMIDEETGEKYARAVGQKGMGERNEMDWLVVDMSRELKSWGHPGGG